MNYLKKHWILLIIVAGLFLRIYKPLELFMYNHDQDLASWIIKDILVNKHLRLIGQETSSHGIFVGPLFYYLQIPFYLLSRMDPVGVLLLSAIFGVFSISSFYFVFSRIFNKNNGLITALIYSISIFIVFTDRSVVPTMPVMLWTVWYFYSLWLLLKGHQKAYLLLGLLLGLVWDLHLALAILSPLIIVAQVFSKKKISFKNIFAGVLIFTILMLPFFVFEA
ncbi:MAG: glycosyltransferase family 39 protein, partial [Patescibacteria group bacterium]